MQIEIPSSGIIVDGYCLGNPGVGGYKGVCLKTKDVLFKKNYPYITNNLAEFLGTCHALGYAKKINTDYGVVYSDSNTAIGWIKSQKISTGISQVKGKQALEDMHKNLLP